ncbi:MAG: beta-glucosidase [Thermomicrobiales bacterium]|nr:beta-glucosidase [Thermomicrobiales bacterium]
MAAASVHFPDDWVWGATTSAYQIEGGGQAGGRGPSIWDTFSATPGKTQGGATGQVAADHFHRVPGDVALMRELGLGAYRFSIAWPRIFPTGTGRPNPDGIDFYRRLIDELTRAGIAPQATLYNWDLPQALQDRSGWLNRDTASRFGEYAHTIAAALGEGIHTWTTISEPGTAGFLGHWSGEHAPGTRSLRAGLQATHNLLLAHGEGLSALRSEMRPGDEAGIALNVVPVHPAGDSNADLEAAHRYDGFQNRWCLDALHTGSYPDDLAPLFGEAMPEVGEHDFRLISQPTDFLGVDYFTRAVVAYDPGNEPLQARLVVPADARLTATGAEIYPRGLHEVLTRVHQDYGPGKLLVTENGAAFPDTVVDGRVEDSAREAFLHEHILEAHRALADGVPLSGYSVWSLLDNFEWQRGYEPRYGLIYVDYASQERILKRSGRWYAEVTRENGVSG